MNQTLTCPIVEDLLPSFAEELTSEETNQAVRAHLAGCPQCRESYARMTGTKDPAPEQASSAQVDYLKKVRKRGFLRTVAAVLLTAALVCAGAWVWVFCIGTEASYDSLWGEVQVDGRTVQVKGATSASALGFARFHWSESDGAVTLRAYTTLVNDWNSGAFAQTYQAKAPVTRVMLGDLVLWEDGRPISMDAARIFNAAHPYVGDMSANERLLQAMGARNALGEMSHVLHTSTQPYGWSITLENAPGKPGLSETLHGYSLILLATVENLDQVEWHFHQDGHMLYTRDRATDALGRDIKEYGQSAAGIQELLDQISRGASQG